MPQASEELRRKWGGEGGVGEDKACDFLEARGFVLTRGWEWYRATPPNEMEGEAMQFLFEEWDWGGYTDSRSGLQSSV